MHDIKFIRENPKAFNQAMERRGLSDVAEEALKLDSERRGDVSDLQILQEESNKLAKMIGQLMAEGKRDEAQEIITRSKEVKEKLQKLKDQQSGEGESSNKDTAELSELDSFLSKLPNIMSKDVPDGKDEDDNVEVRKNGEPKKFNFKAKQHFEIGENLGILDFEDTSKISGARFATLKGNLAKLERALASFMLDLATEEFGYEEVSVPCLARSKALFGTSQLPKFSEDSFKIENSDHYLIATGEIPITNLVREKILSGEELPIRYTGHTECFRSEAGSAGRDTRGLIRMHQFSKVELVSITKPENSEKELDRILSCAEEVLKRLELPYRVMLLCAGDTGFGSHKTYDIEVHLPGQEKYREISSCSNFLDFQARRMNSRYKKSDNENEFVHTLNGSALALGRTIVAILENYQQASGSVLVPEVLKKYTNLEKL